jgi:long-subunit fatty acid transport protein
MNRLLILVIVLIGSISSALAQISTSSHYSRYGLGDLQQSIMPQFNALGGASVAFSDSKTINPSNPATYSSFKSKSFLFSTGGWHQSTRMQNRTAKELVNNNGLSHIVIGFPLTNDIAFSVGMVPFSSTGYDINTVDEIGTSKYYGNGGLSKFYFGGSYQISDYLSLGLNASYLFGSLNRRKSFVYADESFLNSRSNSQINLRGYYYELGLLYTKSVNETDKLSFGMTTNNNSSISAKKSEILESFRISGLLEIPKDTFLITSETGNVVLPNSVNIGLSYNKDKKWLFVVDYNIQKWNEFEMFDESNGNLQNSSIFSGGLQYTPDYNSLNKYYKRMDYRIGASYGNTPLKIDDNHIKEMSLSFGFGIPVKRSRTKYDLSFTIGKRGELKSNLIKEQFVRIGLSVSYEGIWFVKSKYD